MTTKFKKSFSPMLICWNDIKIHLGFEDSYFVPPPIYMSSLMMREKHIVVRNYVGGYCKGGGAFVINITD